MNSLDLDECVVLAAIFTSEPSVSYARGVARRQGTDVVIECENGSTYRVEAGWAGATAMRVDEQVRAAAPAHLSGLLVGVRYLVAVPPPGEDFAMARTPGWRAQLRPKR